MKPFRRHLFWLLTTLLLVPRSSFSQFNRVASLEVLDPRTTWITEGGTIESAELRVYPEGAFMRQELDLTFSARGTRYKAGDTLEVVLRFDLPEAAFVTDSWLWFGEDTLRAKLIDRWSASEIYESIVRRRRDPSILFKNGQGDFELRVFPMDAAETRRVRLFYHVPAVWTADDVAVRLPRNIIDASANPVSSFPVRVATGPDWQDPRILELPGAAFEDGESPGEMTVVLEGDDLESAFTLAYDSPLVNGIYMRTFGRQEGWYQLGLLPGEVFGLDAVRRVTVILDYNARTTHLSQKELIDVSRSLLSHSLEDGDTFNLILSRLEHQMVSDHWMAADPDTISHVFDELGPDPLAAYSNLPFLLKSAIDFIEDEGGGGSILLVSSSDEFGEVEVANALIQDLRDLAGSLPPIHVVDIATQSYREYWFGGRFFSANEYFYSNISRITGGNYESLREGASLIESMDRSLAAAGSTIESFDLHVSPAGGFTYGRMLVDEGPGGRIALNRAVFQVGKMIGGGPFVVNAAGFFEGEPFGQVKVVEDAQSDSSLATLWDGVYLRRLELQGASNSQIAEVIAQSLDTGILSRYTAFLALEPGQEFECVTCVQDPDGGDVTIGAVEEQPDQVDLGISIYPNPFTTFATIEIGAGELPVSSRDVVVEIVDVMGRVVARFDDLAPTGEALSLTWDGTDESGRRLARGTYFVVVRTLDAQWVEKVVLM